MACRLFVVCLLLLALALTQPFLQVQPVLLSDVGIDEDRYKQKSRNWWPHLVVPVIGFGILLFSHEVRHAFGRAEQISVMDNGLIVAQGDRAALLASSHPVVAQLMHRRGAR